MTALGVDIEITNRCNAYCDFCPRDATPHQGLMSQEVFSKALERVLEFSEVNVATFGAASVVETIDLCGLGEPTLHKLAPDFVRQVREAGLRCQMNSNGALLGARRGEALLDAGLQRILINVGEIEEEYEAVYRLPFEKTRDSIVQFAEMAEGRCEVQIVLVDHRHDPAHIARLREYWQSHGLNNVRVIDLMNRGGALHVDHMQYDQYPELQQATAMLESKETKPLCVAPFSYLFIGYDGNYYLCCSDWKKEAPLGTVFERSFVDTMAERLRLVTTRELVCTTCNHDPANRLTDLLRAEAAGMAGAGTAERELGHLDGAWRWEAAANEQMVPGITDITTQPVDARGQRRLIPVNAV